MQIQRADEAGRTEVPQRQVASLDLSDPLFHQFLRESRIGSSEPKGHVACKRPGTAKITDFLKPEDAKPEILSENGDLESLESAGVERDPKLIHKSGASAETFKRHKCIRGQGDVRCAPPVGYSDRERCPATNRYLRTSQESSKPQDNDRAGQKFCKTRVVSGSENTKKLKDIINKSVVDSARHLDIHEKDPWRKEASGVLPMKNLSQRNKENDRTSGLSRFSKHRISPERSSNIVASLYSTSKQDPLGVPRSSRTNKRRNSKSRHEKSSKTLGSSSDNRKMTGNVTIYICSEGSKPANRKSDTSCDSRTCNESSRTVCLCPSTSTAKSFGNDPKESAKYGPATNSSPEPEVLSGILEQDLAQISDHASSARSVRSSTSEAPQLGSWNQDGIHARSFEQPLGDHSSGRIGYQSPSQGPQRMEPDARSESRSVQLQCACCPGAALHGHTGSSEEDEDPSGVRVPYSAESTWEGVKRVCYAPQNNISYPPSELICNCCSYENMHSLREQRNGSRKGSKKSVDQGADEDDGVVAQMLTSGVSKSSNERRESATPRQSTFSDFRIAEQDESGRSGYGRTSEVRNDSNRSISGDPMDRRKTESRLVEGNEGSGASAYGSAEQRSSNLQSGRYDGQGSKESDSRVQQIDAESVSRVVADNYIDPIRTNDKQSSIYAYSDPRSTEYAAVTNVSQYAESTRSYIDGTKISLNESRDRKCPQSFNLLALDQRDERILTSGYSNFPKLPSDSTKIASNQNSTGVLDPARDSTKTTSNQNYSNDPTSSIFTNTASSQNHSCIIEPSESSKTASSQYCDNVINPIGSTRSSASAHYYSCTLDPSGSTKTASCQYYGGVFENPDSKTTASSQYYDVECSLGSDVPLKKGSKSVSRCNSAVEKSQGTSKSSTNDCSLISTSVYSDPCRDDFKSGSHSRISGSFCTKSPESDSTNGCETSVRELKVIDSSKCSGRLPNIEMSSKMEKQPSEATSSIVTVLPSESPCFGSLDSSNTEQKRASSTSRKSSLKWPFSRTKSLISSCRLSRRSTKEKSPSKDATSRVLTTTDSVESSGCADSMSLSGNNTPSTKTPARTKSFFSSCRLSRGSKKDSVIPSVIEEVDENESTACESFTKTPEPSCKSKSSRSSSITVRNGTPSNDHSSISQVTCEDPTTAEPSMLIKSFYSDRGSRQINTGPSQDSGQCDLIRSSVESSRSKSLYSSCEHKKDSTSSHSKSCESRKLSRLNMRSDGSSPMALCTSNEVLRNESSYGTCSGTVRSERERSFSGCESRQIRGAEAPDQHRDRDSGVYEVILSSDNRAEMPSQSRSMPYHHSIASCVAAEESVENRSCTGTQSRSKSSSSDHRNSRAPIGPIISSASVKNGDSTSKSSAMGRDILTESGSMVTRYRSSPKCSTASSTRHGPSFVDEESRDRAWVENNVRGVDSGAGVPLGSTSLSSDHRLSRTSKLGNQSTSLGFESLIRDEALRRSRLSTKVSLRDEATITRYPSVTSNGQNPSMIEIPVAPSPDSPGTPLRGRSTPAEEPGQYARPLERCRCVPNPDPWSEQKFGYHGRSLDRVPFDLELGSRVCDRRGDEVIRVCTLCSRRERERASKLGDNPRVTSFPRAGSYYARAEEAPEVGGRKSQICLYCDQPKERCTCRGPAKKCSYCGMLMDFCNCQIIPEDPNVTDECRCTGRVTRNLEDKGDRGIRMTAWKPRREIREYFSRRDDDQVADCPCCDSLKPYGSDDLPYQRLSVFSDVMSELQQKMSQVSCNHCGQSPCCCCLETPRFAGRSLGESAPRSRSPVTVTFHPCPVTNEIRLPAQKIPMPICDRCKTSPCRCRRKSLENTPEARCYFCKSTPCRCESPNTFVRTNCKCVESTSSNQLVIPIRYPRRNSGSPQMQPRLCPCGNPRCRVPRGQVRR